MRTLLLVVVGAFLGGAISQAVSRQVSASPADVFGSPNVAIDTYRNSRGTYVRWSNGRITSAEGGAQDLGHPYRVPDAAARIGSPSLNDGHPLGSPNVAVRAIPRSDATYVLFSDGNLKRPAHADAAAGSGEGSRVILGQLSWGQANPSYAEPSQEFTWQGNATSGGTATLNEAVSDQARAFISFNYRCLGGINPNVVRLAPGVRSGDGRSFSFSLRSLPSGAQDGVGQLLIVDP